VTLTPRKPVNASTGRIVIALHQQQAQLMQNDIVDVVRFSDDVAYAGWSLDLHIPEGFWGTERGTTFYFFPELHSIPLRCLYARDVDNLWLAGRDISVTHVALGGARLMASCGVAGEAVGIADGFAALLVLELRPSEVTGK
jgi:hypothetical protein